MIVDEQGGHCRTLCGEVELGGEYYNDGGACWDQLSGVGSGIEIDIELPKGLEMVGGESIDGECGWRDERVEEGEWSAEEDEKVQDDPILHCLLY